MRLFVAVYPPADAVTELSGYVAGLHTVRAGARPTRPDTRHVTLAFLGEVPEPRLADVTAAVDLAAGTGHPLDLRIAGGGSFGHGRHTVLWAGLTGAVPELVELARAVRRALARARLPYDRKPPNPHLTIARPGDRLPAEALAEDLTTLTHYQGKPWTADQVTVTESHPGPTPTYHQHHTTLLPPRPAD